MQKNDVMMTEQHLDLIHAEQFDEKAIEDMLFHRLQSTSFYHIEQSLSPLFNSAIDVRLVKQSLYISFLCQQSRRATAAYLQEAHKGNFFEILLAPKADRIGFWQFMFENETCIHKLHHWPYPNERAIALDLPQTEIQYSTQELGEDLLVFASIRMDLSECSWLLDKTKWGFNAMRYNLAKDEASTWSPTSGSGFPDASSSGWIHLQKQTNEQRSSTVQATKPSFHVTYDFPDNVANGLYTRESFENEFQDLKRNGVSRIYWIDNPFSLAAAQTKIDFKGTTNSLRLSQFYEACIADLGEEPVFAARKIAHQLGMEFYVIHKPYDLTLRNSLCPGVEVNHSISELGARYTSSDQQLLALSSSFFSSKEEAPNSAVNKIVLFHVGSCEQIELEVYASQDNESYHVEEAINVYQKLIERPTPNYGPLGNLQGETLRTYTEIEITGITPGQAFYAIQCKDSKGQTIKNIAYDLIHLYEDEIEQASQLLTEARKEDFTTSGFHVESAQNDAAWSNTSMNIFKLKTLSTGDSICIRNGRRAHLMGMLDYGNQAAKDYYFENFVQRAIAIGADGVDIRIAHHHACQDWGTFMFAQPNIDMFIKRYDRPPLNSEDDMAKLRRIRGEFHTQLMRETKTLLTPHNIKLEAHLEARMTVPADYDTYMQIEWDYETWIKEGLVSALNLKYLQAMNPFIQEKVKPLAKKHGISLHVIGAIGDPRTNVRTPELTEDFYRQTAIGGLQAINLYEMWVYARTTATGENFYRGCGKETIERIGNLIK